MAPPEGRPIRVKVMDKRTSARAGAAVDEAVPVPENRHNMEEASAPGQGDEAVREAAQQVEEAERDLLDDLRRLQAEFDNYRKRVLREQTAMTTRASARLVERLLPVLDNFERAIEHGEGGPGMELVLKDFKRVLEQEGLEEIEAQGAAFDPRVHDAFQVVEDEDVPEPTVRAVYRRGYRMGDAVLRAPMVVVAQPAGGDAPESEPEPQSSSAGGTEG